jgi:hypothetical protein
MYGYTVHVKVHVGGESRLLQRPETFPAWENPNMLAKYYVSTKGVELAGLES